MDGLATQTTLCGCNNTFYSELLAVYFRLLPYASAGGKVRPLHEEEAPWTHEIDRRAK